VVRYLYKYTKLDATTISNLVNDLIYFNLVENFNDPTDSAFTILTGGETTSTENRIEDLKTVCKFMGVKYQHEAKEGQNSLALTQISIQLEAALKKYIGVCCFSEHQRCLTCECPSLCPLMLSHYAYGHTGIIIEYECTQPDHIKAVQYKKTSEHFNYASIMKGFKPKYFPIKCLEINDDIIAPLLFKFEQWRAQEEKRIFSEPLQLKSCPDFGLKIKSIYFGVRTPNDLAQSLEKVLADRDIKFYYLRLPISHSESQSILIFDDWARGWQRNSCNECSYSY
jgi:hypothetical protein